MRDNGAITGGAGGFLTGDKVIVLRKLDGSKTYVIGHVDGVRLCGGFAVIVSKLYGYVKYSVAVWDIRKNEVLFAARDYDDVDFQNWLATKSYIGIPMHGVGTKCGRVANVNGTYASACPELTPGMTDSVSHTASSEFVAYCSWGDAWNQTGEVNYDIKSMAWGSLPMGSVVPVSIPDCPTKMTGYRLHEIYDFSFVTINSCSTGMAKWNEVRSDSFYGPLGLLTTYVSTLIASYSGGPWDWGLTIPRPFTCYALSEEMMYDPTENTLILKYLRQNMAGYYSDNFIVNLFVLQFCPVYVDGQVTGVVITPQNRQVYAQAQALSCSGGSKGYDWIAAGRNTALEAEIISVVNLNYDLNSLASNTLIHGDCSISIYK